MLAGAVVGVLLGATGMGGGSLMTPILLLFGIPVTKAIGTDLLFAAVTKSLGSVQHTLYKQVDWRLVRWLAVGSMPGSFAGALLVTLFSRDLTGADNLLKGVIAVLVIVAGAAMTRKWSKSGKEKVFRPWLASLTGLTLGLLVGFTSIGSGTLFAVVLSLGFGLAPRLLVGTDIVHGTLLVWSAAAAHAIVGNVQYGTVSWLLVGSLPGIVIGSLLTRRIPIRPLRLCLAGVLIVSGLLILQSI